MREQTKAIIKGEDVSDHYLDIQWNALMCHLSLVLFSSFFFHAIDFFFWSFYISQIKGEDIIKRWEQTKKHVGND